MRPNFHKNLQIAWGTMPHYRIYSVQKNGRLVDRPPVVIKSATDKQVIQKAPEMLGEYDLEVWEQTRVVARLKSPTAK